MNILAIDTTGKVSSCALLEEGKLVGAFDVNIPLTHSETALPMVEDLLRESHFTLSQINVFAVAAGPGSFTGVRIGVSAIKGLAMALNKPCIGISTLEALAQNTEGFEGWIVPAMDARRNQVYGAAFRWENGELLRLLVDQVEDAKDFSQQLPTGKEKIWILGDGAEILLNALPQKNEARLIPEDLRLQKASSVARRAQWIVENQPDKIVSAEELAVDYLRLSQAERERKERIMKMEQTGGSL